MVCLVGLSPGQYFYFQEVFPVLAAKHCIMQANAEYHQSILAKQQKKFGEEIARLQVSLLAINSWVTWFSIFFLVRFSGLLIKNFTILCPSQQR
jgi:hypothetical protein